MTHAAPPTYRLLWRLLLVFWVAVPGIVAQAAEVSVRASLSRPVAVVGDPVQYQIKITGARGSIERPEVVADGLTVRYAGPVENSVMRFNNGSFSSERTISFIYQVGAEKGGTFMIPAVTVEVDGKAYRTEPVGLTVQSNAAGATGGQSQVNGFAEFVVPKKTAYVGEAMPVELRLYVDSRLRWEPIEMPKIVGEGFTKQKFPEQPQREQEEKNGRLFDVLIFKTAITPGRAGKITLGPSEIPYQARIPRPRKSGPRSLFDMFDDDIFGDPRFGSYQQLKAKAEAIDITVKPLPAEGKPRDFSGAVGSFQLSAEGTPRQVKVGDPVTMKLRVKGSGNFDRMSAPMLQDPTGWRTYPPSSAFKAEAGDEIGYSGTKTFEMAVVPETKKAALPVFEFSYFDPRTEKYVTLKSETAPLDVQGGVASAATPPPVSASNAPAATPPPAPARPNDILGLRYDPDSARDSAPLHTRREYWMAQGGMGLALLAFLGFRLRRRPDAAARAAAELRREKSASWARLRSADLGHVEFLQTAARIAQIETALATGRNAASIDAATVRAFGSLSDESKTVIDDIFSTRAELLYAGGGRDEGPVSAVEREKVLGALRELEKGHARH